MTYSGSGCVLAVLRAEAGDVRDDGAGRDGAREPHVAADGAAGPHDGLAAEDGRIRVEDHVVLDGGVPLGLREALLDEQRAQRDALEHPHAVPHDGRLADHDARPVVDGEGVADLRAGVDIDAGLAVGHFGEQTRDERDALAVEAVRQPVHGRGVETGVGEDDLVDALGRRVARGRRLGVLPEPLAEPGEFGERRSGQRLGALGHDRRQKPAHERLEAARLSASVAASGEGGEEERQRRPHHLLGVLHERRPLDVRLALSLDLRSEGVEVEEGRGRHGTRACGAL